MSNPILNEAWYHPEQIKDLVEYSHKAIDLSGLFIEIGCWEGNSTVALTNAIAPRKLICIDNWSMVAPDGRDVFKIFNDNMETCTGGNYEINIVDCNEYLNQLKEPIAFLHLDGPHDFTSVKRSIDLAKPLLCKGGVICGDDFISGGRENLTLDGGVQRAVEEALPGFVHDKSVRSHNFWYWINV